MFRCVRILFLLMNGRNDVWIVFTVSLLLQRIFVDVRRRVPMTEKRIFAVLNTFPEKATAIPGLVYLSYFRRRSLVTARKEKVPETCGLMYSSFKLITLL